MTTFLERLETITPPSETVAVFRLEQSHTVIKTPQGDIIHIDPFMSRVVRPENHILPEPVASPAETPADLIFLTHDHRDHIDVHTLKPLMEGNPKCRIIAPTEGYLRCVDAGIDPTRIQQVSVGMEGEIPPCNVRVVYSENTEPENATTHLGYILEVEGVVIYHLGDTKAEPDSYQERLESIRDLRPDLLIVPINDKHANPGPQGAARLVELVDPDLIIPCHYDCFISNSLDPELFIQALPEARRSSVRRVQPGEGIIVGQ